MDDPRVYFAAERTTLAWIRTGIAMIGLGFVVARFGLFMTYLAHPESDPGKQGFSLTLGILLVALGSLTCVMSGFQFWWYIRHMRSEELPPRYFVHLATTASFALGIIGSLLAIHLLR